MMTNACTGYVHDEDVIIGDNEVSSTNGISAISIHLSDEQTSSCEYMMELADKIVNDRNFARNPTHYLGSRSTDTESGNEVAFEMDDSILRILRALSDEEIADAISNNDIKRYIHLMYQKGLLNQNLREYESVLSSEDKKKLLESIGMSDLADNEIDEIVVGAITFLFYFVAAVVSCATVLFTTIVTAQFGFGYVVATTMAAYTDVKVAGSSHTYLDISRDFDIWVLSKEQDHSIFLKDENLDKAVDDVVCGFKEIVESNKNSEAKIDDNKMKQTINLNINKQLEISAKLINKTDDESIQIKD
ncbi:hypothetical protein [uncultured Muribaculum sp.]|nr:hypothetical protein [uncultured Muribaculum sp.]